MFIYFLIGNNNSHLQTNFNQAFKISKAFNNVDNYVNFTLFFEIKNIIVSNY